MSLAIPLRASPDSPELEIALLSPLTVAQRIWRRGNSAQVTVIVKLTFALEHGREARLVETEPFAVPGKPTADAELAPHLPCAGVTVTGHARTPTGTLTRRMSVRASLSASAPNSGADVGKLFDKTLLVVGNRRDADEFPDMFDEMPLSDELSYGGPGYEDNPVGIGLGPQQGAQANILPADGSASFSGFGPVPRSRPSRRRRLGRLSLETIDALVPTFPEDFDWSYFHVAPTDQQTPYLTSREWVRLEGMDAELAVIESGLPWLAPRGRIRRAPKGPIDELVFHADYLSVNADKRSCSLLWRAHLQVDIESMGQCRGIVGLENRGRAVDWPDGWKDAAEADETLDAATMAFMWSGISPDGMPGTTTDPSTITLSPAVPPPSSVHPQSVQPVSAPKTAAPDSSGSLRQRDTKVIETAEVNDIIQRSVTPFRAPEAPTPAAVVREPPHYVPPPARIGPPLVAPPKSAPPEPPPMMGVPPQTTSDPADARAIATPSFLLGARQLFRSAAPEPEHGSIHQPNIQQSVLDKSLPMPPFAVAQAQQTPASAKSAIAPPQEIVPSSRRTDVLARIARRESLDGLDLAKVDLSEIDFHGQSLIGTSLRGTKLCRCNFQDANLTKAILERADLTDADLGGANLERANLRATTLSRASFEQAKLVDTDFDGASGESTSFRSATGNRTILRNAQLREGDFRLAQLTTADLGGANIEDSDLSNAVLTHCRFEKATLLRVKLNGARLDSTRWQEAKIDDCSFRQATLTHANFDRAELSRARFHTGELRDASFREAKANECELSKSQIRDSDWRSARLVLCNFDGADIAGGVFRNAILERASLDSAKLDGVDMSEAQISKSSFVGARLRSARAIGTDLTGADLMRADLSSATFRGAILRGADLSFARVEGADFSEATLTNACLFRVDQARASFTLANLEGIDTTTDRRKERPNPSGEPT